MGRKGLAVKERRAPWCCALGAWLLSRRRFVAVSLLREETAQQVGGGRTTTLFLLQAPSSAAPAISHQHTRHTKYTPCKKRPRLCKDTPTAECLGSQAAPRPSHKKPDPRPQGTERRGPRKRPKEPLKLPPVPAERGPSDFLLSSIITCRKAGEKPAGRTPHHRVQACPVPRFPRLRGLPLALVSEVVVEQAGTW